MKKIGIDIETSGVEYDAQLAGVSIYDPEQDFVQFYPINMLGVTEQMRNESLAKVREYLSNYALVGHNLMFDLIHLRQLFPDVQFNVAGDSMIIAHMAQLKSGKLKDLVLAYGIANSSDIMKLSDIVEDFNFASLSVSDEEAIRYACHDAEWAYKLESLLSKKYEKSLKLYSLELRVLPVFVDMTVSGLRLQWDEFQHFIQKYTIMVDSLKAELDREAGFSFATRSRRDMESIIVDKFGLVPSSRTPKGEYSYSLESLRPLDHPWVQKYLDYSHKFSTRSSLQTLDKFVYREDGSWFVHPTYLQVGFDGTSRVYTTDPSTNQLPREFRDYVKPNPGMKFMYADWSAAELAVAVFWAREPRLLDAYRKGADLHRLIASELLDKPYESVTDEDMKLSKVITFSILYGSEGAAAARALGISVEEGSRFVQKFWEKFPCILDLRERIQAQAKRTFRTWTVVGRTRRLTNLELGADEGKGLRQAFNTAIQSSVADFQKLALIRLANWLPSIGGRIATTVFDSFLLEVPEDVVEDDVRPVLDQIFTYQVDGFEWKFNFELKFGWTWGEF